MEASDLRECATAVYLAVEESIAKDISANLKWAADEIERLESKIKELEDAYNDLDDKMGDMTF